MPHEGVAEPDDPVGNAAPVLEVGREDEAGNAQEDENVDTGVHFCGITMSGMPAIHR